MAHLTISLGAPVVVPFRIPRGWSGHRRAKAWNAHIRWRSFCEAALAAVDRNQIESSVSFHVPGDPQRLHAPSSGKDMRS